VARAFFLLLVAPVVIWTARALIIRAVGPGAPTWVWADLSWLGALGFAGGWMLLGMALRPAGSALRGLVLAFVLYAVAGLLWTFALQLALGRPFIAIASDTGLLLFAFLWPLQVAQVTGLFGLSY
jgi:hypothetical protein